MKKLLGIVVLGLLICNISFSDNFRVGQKIKNSLNISKNLKIKLSKGDWVVARNISDQWRGITQRIVGIARLENNEIMEMVEVYEGVVAGILISDVDPILIELVFKNKYDGCYDRPEYSVMEFYKKGSSHNCFWVGHHDLIKHIYNPDNPELKTANTQLKMWLNEKKITLPEVALYSEHSYFSRLAKGKWYGLVYVIDPKILNAPDNSFIKEDSSEYHKYNIDKYPEHKKIMKKWISISAQRHMDFENLVSAKKHHKLDLNNFSPIKSTSSQNQSDTLINQLKNLNDLFKNRVLTREEFEKAKKKLLN